MGCRCWFCVFGSVLLMFLLYVLAVRSRNCLEDSLDVRSAVSGFVLSSLGFSPTSFLFLFVFSFERQSSGSKENGFSR